MFTGHLERISFFFFFLLLVAPEKHKTRCSSRLNRSRRLCSESLSGEPCRPRWCQRQWGLQAGGLPWTLPPFGAGSLPFPQPPLRKSRETKGMLHSQITLVRKNEARIARIAGGI